MGTALAIVGGRYAEGIPWYEKAVLLNPTDPRKWIYLSQLALSHLGNGEPEKAIQFAEEAVHQQLEVSEPLITLAATLGYLGRTSEAAEILERVGDDATEFVEKHTVYCDDLKEVILGGLRKADMRD